MGALTGSDMPEIGLKILAGEFEKCGCEITNKNPHRFAGTPGPAFSLQNPRLRAETREPEIRLYCTTPWGLNLRALH